MDDSSSMRELNAAEVTDAVQNALRWVSKRYEFPMVAEIDTDGVDLTVQFGSGQRFRIAISELERGQPTSAQSALTALEARAAAMQATTSE